MTTGRALAGRRILITRPAERARDLVPALEALGASVLLRPTIAIEPASDPAPARRALAGIDGYDFLVFTSRSGAERFSTLLARERAGRRPAGKIVAIGPGTARALEDLGLAADLVANDSRAEGLVAVLLATPIAGKRILIVRPEASRELLPDALLEAGASVDSVPFYRTVQAPGAGKAALELTSGAVDAILFTSPSTFHALLDAAGEDRARLRAALGSLIRVAIGPVTAEALERDGLAPHAVAASPSSTSILDALLRALRRSTGSVC